MGSIAIKSVKPTAQWHPLNEALFGKKIEVPIDSSEAQIRHLRLEPLVYPIGSRMCLCFPEYLKDPFSADR
jgi:hypothetical protein